MSGISTPPSLRALRWCLLVLFGYALVRTAWLCDDAYITFRVVDNFAHGYGLRWNVAERVQVFTHPLWMLVLAPLYLLTREIYFTALVLSLGSALVAASCIAFKLARNAAWGALGLAVLTSSKAFVDYSTSGLENSLTHALLALFAWRVLRGLDRPRDVGQATVLAGLGMLNRMDAALLFLPPLIWALRDRRGAKLVLPLAASLVPLASWLAFSTLYYGFPLPNTAHAKLGTGLARRDLLDRGIAYAQNSLTWDPLTLLTLVTAAIACVLARSRRLAAFVVAAVVYLAYVLAIGGDFMSGRFFTAPLVYAVVVIVSSDERDRRATPLVATAAALLVGLVAPYPVLSSGSRYGLSRTDLVDPRGIADERGYYYWMTGWLNAREGPKPANMDVSRMRAWKSCGYPLAVEGAVGFVGFTAGPGMHVIDFHGLADPLLARLPSVESDPLYESFCEATIGRKCSDPVRTGHYTRTIPAGYLSWTLGRGGRFEDPDLARFVAELALATRAPLVDRERLGAVWAFNLGRHDDLVGSGALVPYAEPRWHEVNELAYLGVGRAEADLRAVLAACPRDTDAAMALAIDLWAKGGRDREVIDLCRRALEIDPWLERAYNGLGHAHARLGETEEALRAFDRALALDPTMAEALSGRARLLNEIGARD